MMTALSQISLTCSYIYCFNLLCLCFEFVYVLFYAMIPQDSQFIVCNGYDSEEEKKNRNTKSGVIKLILLKGEVSP